MAARALIVAVRVALALEFAAALVTWGLGVLRWELACAITTSTLIGFLCAWGEADDGIEYAEPCAPASSREGQ